MILLFTPNQHVPLKLHAGIRASLKVTLTRGPNCVAKYIGFLRVRYRVLGTPPDLGKRNLQGQFGNLGLNCTSWTLSIVHLDTKSTEPRTPSFKRNRQSLI